MDASRAVLLLAVTIAAPACGEDVNFTTGRVDGGTNDGSLEPSDSSPAPRDATAIGDVAFGRMRRGCAMGFDAGAYFCDENGSFCGDPRDCCSGRCEQGYCLTSGACSAPGAPCNNRKDCCSERCEPSGGTPGLVCLQYCQADGTPCHDASDCCSLGCNGGMCGGRLCVTAGGSCVVDSQCCSGRCAGGECALVSSACLPTGEGCSVDGGGITCCSRYCPASTGRCDLGSGNCREASSPCTQDSDCCLGRCLRNAQGIDVCTAPCRAEGDDCYSNGDCCDPLACSGSPLRCGALSPRCP